MSYARDRIHAKYCPDTACDSNGIDDAGEACKSFDFLLDRVADDRVHAEVHRILDISLDTTLTHGVEVTQGLGLAIKTIDPFVLRDGELRRKSDGRQLMHCEKCTTK